MDLFLAGEAGHVSFDVGLWHSLVEALGRNGLEDRSAVLLVVDPEAN